MDEPENIYPVTTCMDVYKANIQSDGCLEKLKLVILFRGYFQKKEMNGDTWDTTSSMMNLKYFLENSAKHKSIVHQLSFIGEFLQANDKHIVLVKLDSRYGEYLPEYTNYFVIPLRIKRSMYGINNSGNLFDYELTNWLIYEAGFNQSKYQISVYYKYAPDGSRLFLLSYVDACVYCYTSE